VLGLWTRGLCLSFGRAATWSLAAADGIVDQ
jgi:hypothetical protein